MILDLERVEDAPTLDATPIPPPGNDNINIMSPPTPTGPNFPGFCQAFLTVAIPESVAKETREIGISAMIVFAQSIMTSYGYNTLDYQEPYFSTVADSPVPTAGPWCKMGFGATPTELCVTATYAGYQTPTTSVPGTVIVEPPPPPPVMPPPPEPPILRECRQRIKKEIQQPVDESGYILDRLKSQATGQIDYQLAQVEPALDKITNKINSNIINTMGEVYQGAYPIGLGIPSTEQIMTGEPVYSPYGIGADQNLPYCDSPTPTYTPTETPYTPPDSPYTPTLSPTPTLPPTTPPGVSCPAPVVQCPAPPDIIFKPNITINFPKEEEICDASLPFSEDGILPIDGGASPLAGGASPLIEMVASPSPSFIPSPSPSSSPTPSPTPKPCKPPPPPPEKPPKPAPLDIIEGSLSPNQTNWESGQACGAAPNSGNFNPESIWDAFGWSVVKPGEYKPPGYLDPANYPGPSKYLGAFLMNLYGLMIQTTVKATVASIPIVNNWQDFLTLAMGGAVQNWVGAPVLEFMKSTVYNINYNNPQSIPSEAECVNLYLAGEIDEQTMRCLVRANGSYDTWYSKIANSGRTKLSNDQIIQLRRREILDDSTTNKLMRGNGVIDEQEQLWIYKATEAMPSVSDIVRFMVRDADDNTVAERYGTDAQLSTKYGAQLQSWAKGQGITDEVMKYYWRSHWEIPSNTALFEMLHRLRPNRTGQGLTGGITVSQQDIKDALVVNDVLPFWAERLMEISYRPLTRTDAQRAYFIDALSENELKDSYLDLGYNNDNADRLVRFTNQLKAKRKQTTGGTEKVPTILKYYKNWLIGDTEATQRLKNSGLSETAAKDALQIANVQRKNDSQVKCIAGVKSQFKRYIINDIEARRDLTDIGVALENVGPLVNNWKCERASKPKELSATQVCQAYQNNLINDVEYRRRMGAIGYQEDEAGILLEICRTKKGNLNDGSGDTTRIRTQQEKNDQTAAARAITAAAMLALNPPSTP